MSLIDKILEIIVFFILAILAVVGFAFAIFFIGAVTIGPVILAKEFENNWFLLLYIIIAAFIVYDSPEYLTREDNGEEMP